VTKLKTCANSIKRKTGKLADGKTISIHGEIEGTAEHLVITESAYLDGR